MSQKITDVDDFKAKWRARLPQEIADELIDDFESVIEKKDDDAYYEALEMGEYS